MKTMQCLLLATLLGTALLFPRLVGPLGAAAVWVCCLGMLSRLHPNRLLSFGAIYLLMLGVFHLGLVVPDALGVRMNRPAWLMSRQVTTALGLFVVAALAFTLGARLRAPASGLEPVPPVPPQRELFLIGCAVAVAGAVILWIGVMQLGLMNVGYNTYFERAVTGDVRFFAFGLMLFPIGILVAAVGANGRQIAALTAMTVAVLGPLFMTGFRGPVLVQVVALLAVWAHKDRRAARAVTVAALGAALLLAPAIRVARDHGAGDDSDAPRDALDPLSVILEAGGSLYPLVITAERVEPGLEEPWMGRSYLTALSRVLINMSSRRATERILTPGAWATMHADTWAFENGYGIGYSGVAEPYLNFGTLGVAVIFLLLGVVIHSWERWLERDPFRAAIGAASFGFVLWTVRNEATEVFRAMALASGAVLAAWVITQLRARGGEAVALEDAPPG